MPKPWLCGFKPGVIYETKACQSTTSHGFWPIASRNGGWVCDGWPMIRNNQRIKGGLVGEETGCVDMSTYGVEEFRRILRFQLNRHWRSFVFKLCCRLYECGVSWGIRSLFIEIAQERIRYSWSSRSGMFSGMMNSPYIMSPTLPSTPQDSSLSILLPFGDHLSRCLDSHLWGLFGCTQSLHPPSAPSGAPEVTGRDLHHMTNICEKKT